ncbi:hypothetical protein [Ferrovum sp.]|uniref:hypothetical protein n=1 Tax=Ferrovum sp. TaxID=2609467 RepID=UPI002630B216|nr:hypothetical protein [Ferrovum sp.]
MKKGMQGVGVLLLMMQSALAQEQGNGWFSGISALPFSVQWNTELAPEGSALSSHMRSEGLGGAETSGLSRSWVLGGTGTLPLGDSLALTGSLATIRNQGLGSAANTSTVGLYDALPYNMTGLGMHYDLSQRLRFQGGWDHYQLNYNRINGNSNIDLLSLGLRYGF